MSKGTDLKPGETAIVRVKKRGRARGRVEVVAGDDVSRKGNSIVEGETTRYVRRGGRIIVEFYEIADAAGAYEGSPADIALLDGDGAPYVTLAKQQAIDAAVVAAWSPENSTPLNAEEDHYVGDTYALHPNTNPDTWWAGVNDTEIEQQGAPYKLAQYDWRKQNTKDLGSNRMLFKKVPQNNNAIRVGDDFTWPRFYTGFDPDYPSELNSDGFKVTKEPSFSAPRVDLKIKGGTTVKVHLKRYPVMFGLQFAITHYFPYPYWNTETNFHFGSNHRADWLGLSSVTVPLENWYSDKPFTKTRSLHWQGRVLSYSYGGAGVDQAKTQADTDLEDHFTSLLEQNGWGNAGQGYTWFPSVYSGMVPNTEAEALAREAAGDLPRYNDSLPRGYFVHRGAGGGSTAAWKYQGEFVGGVVYGGEQYYVWRYTQGGESYASGGGIGTTVPVSNSGWELEPGNLWLSETIIVANGTESDHHKVIDTVNPMQVHVHYGQGGLGDFDGDVDLFYQPKYITDFGARPRRYQT